MESAIGCSGWFEIANLAVASIILPLLFSVALRLARWEWDGMPFRRRRPVAWEPTEECDNDRGSG